MAEGVSDARGKLYSRGGAYSPVGSLFMPGQEMEVQVMSPPKIVWYWVLKQSIDRLRDAINAERADRRVEYLFGCSGLAIGTLRDACVTMGIVADKPEELTVMDFVLTCTFVISLFFVAYFGAFAEKKERTANRVLSDILDNEYGANATGPLSEPGRSGAGGKAGTVQEGALSGSC